MPKIAQNRCFAKMYRQRKTRNAESLNITFLHMKVVGFLSFVFGKIILEYSNKSSQLLYWIK